ncbi:zinc finger imprinted 2-like [Protopterus annectens]|uniref:zinc finger imprinted 2-like n=1 Tax=Protopterus annectens TaxID=7888 RepID=UPI001CF9D4AE|nr:zinc finger imprinted 2-like [Protopterus annectens]
MEEKFECIKTGVSEIHSAVSDINFGFKKEVDILEERDDTDNLSTTGESVLNDTSEHGKHKTNGVLSAPESFEDVAVTFSAEEMKMLTKQDKELHKEVMLENYETLVSAGRSCPILRSGLCSESYEYLIKMLC